MKIIAKDWTYKYIIFTTFIIRGLIYGLGDLIAGNIWTAWTKWLDPYLILFLLTIIVMACMYNLKKNLYLTKYYFIIICFQKHICILNHYSHKESYQTWCQLIHRVQICSAVVTQHILSIYKCGFFILNYGINLFI